MKVKMQKRGKMIALAFLCLLAFAMHGSIARAEGVTAVLTTDRNNGISSYTVGGLDLAVHTALTVQVERTDNKSVVWTQEITLSEENVSNGSYTGTFTLQDLKYEYASYNVNVIVGGVTVQAGVCDFSIHQNKVSMVMNGDKGSASRTVSMAYKDEAGAVLAPGIGNQVAVYAWQQGKSEDAAKMIGAPQNLTGTALNWTVDIRQAGIAYGKWNAKLVLVNSQYGVSRNLTTVSYEIAPTCVSFEEKKSASLEKQKSFQMVLNGLQNVVPVESVTFLFYDEKNKQVYKTGAKKSGSKYIATIKLKKLGYKLKLYTVKAVITDTENVSQELAIVADADEQVIPGSFDVLIKNNATSKMTLTGAYIPGNIKKVSYVIRERDTGKKIGDFETKGKKKKYTAVIPSEAVGKYTVTAYGYTNWNKKVALAAKNYKIGKEDMGKQGWFYEKYQGKKYRFYYVDNERVTDLTKVLKLKKGSGKYIIEVNRAAGVVTIYMYNDETGRYDIPVKACTVSVGRDVWTAAGTSGLNTDSSYTPIGDYSVCSNGEAVRYPLKTMHEPDGSIVYARWCTHIVGNVYFHSIAVGAQSHYALSSSTYNRLGSPASAGCIRMAVADAKWLYDYMPTGTPIKIKVGSSSKPGPLGKPEMIKTNYGVNYDPTDPEVPDSRKKKDYKAGKITGYINNKGEKIGYE